ncbi:MAG: cytochrome b/b6 domain-containing protein [Chloroflexi bacterium]|nr:cytochrome b/b6 domain-containing protein [Chloroflexota bacterium]
MAAVTESVPVTAARTAEGQIVRFDVHQVIQHAGLMVTFILLVVTGLPLKFPESAISQWWVGVWGGVEVTRSIHRVAAWAIVVVCLYHLGYLLYTILILKKPFPVRMVPSGDDVVKLFQEIAYFFGLIKEPPKWHRFNWREKFDYWAIFWGMPVMAGSGFILMYPVLVTRVLPGWVVPTALIAHSDEAMLALVWIFMVHIFFNHFSPGIFPLNKSIFTGKVSGERYRRDHPLEYEEMFPATQDKEE